MADSYDPYERKREIKQLTKSYMVLRDRRVNNPNIRTPKMWFFLEILYYYKLRDAQNCRYVVGNRRLHYRQRDWRLFLHSALDESEESNVNSREFRERYRMDRTSFYQLHDRIKNHAVFQSNKSGQQQVDSKYQLLWFLAHIGTQGCGMSSRKSVHQFPSSYGSFVLFQKRCITAILTLHDEAYFWPEAEERKVIAQKFHEKYHVPHVVGVADGTLFPLDFKPNRNDYPDFKGRKGKYTITCLIVNDHMRRIRYYHLGWPGNVHDERVFRQCPLATTPERYFSVGDVLLGDSAYTPRKNMVSVYKKGYGEPRLSASKEQFNTIISRPRVSSEHTIGILKARFCSLREIRLKITEDPESFKKVLNYVRVCIIIHNLLVGWTDSDFEFKENTENTTMQTTGTEVRANNDDNVNHTTGEIRRQQMYDRLMLDGVHDLIQGDIRDGLSRDRFD